MYICTYIYIYAYIYMYIGPMDDPGIRAPRLEAPRPESAENAGSPSRGRIVTMITTTITITTSK